MENAMSLMSAGALASVLSFLIFVIMAALYVGPWLATRQRAEALISIADPKFHNELYDYAERAHLLEGQWPTKALSSLTPRNAKDAVCA